MTSEVPSAEKPAGAAKAPDGQVAPGRARALRRRSSLFVKFALIGLLGNLPILYFGYKFVSLNLEEVAFAEKEQIGIAYLPHVWPIYEAAIAGERAPVGAFAALAAAGTLYDETLGTAFYRQRFAEANLTGGENAIAAGRSFIARIADNSYLSVDPDLNTLRAVAIVATNLPDVAESALMLFGDLQAVVDEAQRAGALDRFDRASALLTESLAATDALNFNTELTARLGATQAALNRATQRFMTAAATVPIGPGEAGDPTLAAAYTEFQTALGAFWRSAAAALDVLLANRVAWLEGQLWSEIEIALGLYLVVMLLIGLFARSLVGRSRSLMRVVNRMRAGNLEDGVPHTGHYDEIGDLARAVDVFRSGLLEKRAADEAIQRQNAALVEHRAALEEQNLRFDAALNNMRHGLAMFDRDRRLVVWNRRFAEIYRLSESALSVGASYKAVVDLALARARPADGSAAVADVLAHAGAGESIFEFDDGRVLFVSNARMPDGGIVTTHEDITERRRAEAQITYMEFHDALTMLPNRVLFTDRLDQSLAQLPPGGNVALLHIDLDNFKSVNDTLGHQTADSLLKLVSERLLAAVDVGAFVARLAGDEFAVVLSGPGGPRAAARLSDRIIDRLSRPYHIDSHSVAVGASIGIAVAPEHGSDAEALLKNADLALYRAKTDGRGGHRFFDPEMDAELQTRRVLEIDLRQALAHDELELYFQPLVDIETDMVAGFEALLRWHHPSRGLVQPGDFIPLAEESGLIVPIGEWVLRRACAEAATWPDDVKVAVNLSSVQFRNRKLVSTVVNALSASQLRPARLELEITESLLLQDNEATVQTLHQLRSLGVRIAMDDFGTGYSSLSYLRSFPFDKIKIDRSFVHDLAEKEESLAIIRAVVGLGKGLGIRTTAEGVETPRQLQILRDIGYSEVQGLLFGAPKPAAEVPRMLGSAHRSRAVA